MNVKGILSLLVLFLATCSVSAKLEGHMTKVECSNYAPDLFKNVSCVLIRPAQSTSSLSVEFALTQNVIKLEGVYMLTMVRGSQMTNLTAVKIDLCEILASVQSYFLLKMITTEIRRIGNLPLECPFKMNTRYYVNRFSINGKVIPSYMPAMNFISDFHIFFQDREAFRLTINGRLIRRH